MKNTKLSNRGRKFNQAKYAIVRAWEIARNAAVAHNTNPVDVARQGLVKASEYFAESLRLAWKEARQKKAKMENPEMYTLHKVPKKNQKSILNAIDILVATKASVKEKPSNFEVAMTVFDARFTTGAARSTHRHVMHSLERITDHNELPEVAQEFSTYGLQVA